MTSKTALESFKNNQELLASYSHEWNLEEIYTLMDAAYQEGNEKELIHQANEMWFYLPDRESIRTSGFFALCDIAERMFDDDA